MMPEPTTFSSIGWLAMGLAALAVAWNQIDDWIQRRMGKDKQMEISPSPLIVTAAERFVARDDYEKAMLANQTEHNNLFSKIGGVERGMRQALKADVDELHEKINRANESLAAVGKGMEFQNQRLLSISHTVERILEKRS